MDLAQKASKVKRDLNAAVNKLEATSVRHAVESFESFADAVVEEIETLKKFHKESERAAGRLTSTSGSASPSTSGGPADTGSGSEERRESTPA